jgi:hypothetical protein
VQYTEESGQVRGTHELETTEETSQDTEREQPLQARDTHSLETTVGGTDQVTERKRQCWGNSLSGDRRRRDKSKNGKKGADEVTHLLEIAEGWPSQDTERK